MLRNLSIRSKLWCLIGLLLLVSGSIAIYGIQALSSVGSELKGIAHEDIPLSKLLAEIEVAQLKQDVVLEKALRAGDVKSEQSADGFVADFRQKSKHIQTALKEAEKIAAVMISSGDEEARHEGGKVLESLKRIEAEHTEFEKHADVVFQHVAKDQLVEAARLAVALEDEAEKITAELEAMAKEVAEFTATAALHAETTEHRAEKVLLIIFAAGVLIGGGVGILIARAVSRPLSDLAATISQTEKTNDLTLRAPIHGRDEVGQAAAAFNSLASSFEQIISRIGTSAEQVAAASEELSTASDQVAAASQQQADAAGEMAAAVEELTVSVSQISDHARQANEHAHSSAEISTQGSASVGGLTEQIQKAAASIRATAQTMDALGQQTSNISQIVNVIADVAGQTNLLALNAAIEAARAGEQGRGFAVVADEVRKLAERTAKSTSEIAAMIERIQSEASSAVQAIEFGVTQVNAQEGLAAAVGQDIRRAAESSDRVSRVIGEISATIQEQHVASTEIARNVERIAQMTDENNAAVQSSAETARYLASIASELQISATRFRVGASAAH